MPCPPQRRIGPRALRVSLQRLADVRQTDVGVVGQITKPEKRCLIDWILVQHGLKGSPGLFPSSGPCCPHPFSQILCDGQISSPERVARRLHRFLKRSCLPTAQAPRARNAQRKHSGYPPRAGLTPTTQQRCSRLSLYRALCGAALQPGYRLVKRTLVRPEADAIAGQVETVDGAGRTGII